MKEQLTIQDPKLGQVENGARIEGQRRLPWYLALLCRCGIHRGRWTYIAEDKCQQLRLCPRCGNAGTRTRHIRSWQYTAKGECEQTKECARCHQSAGRRIVHDWGPTWESGSWFSTKENHRCLRCGKTESWHANSDD